jgi:NAD(P)-dependent dehydrogenase (short-subunit alcohol dehydrogenase family)
MGLHLDVTEADSVAAAFGQVSRTWGGVDLVVANAGVAMVASLTELDLERYRKLERVNVEGTLLVLAEAARLFRRQKTGGDVVLVSTKNVFSPGASFGGTRIPAHLTTGEGKDFECADIPTLYAVLGSYVPSEVPSIGIGCPVTGGRTERGVPAHGGNRPAGWGKGRS